MSGSPWPGTKKTMTKLASDGQYLAAVEIVKIVLLNSKTENDDEIKSKLIKTINIYIRVLDAIQKGEIIKDLDLD